MLGTVVYRYILLNIMVLLGAAGGLSAYRCWSYWRRRMWFGVATLLLLTAVFDSLIIGLQLVSYNQAHIVGIYIINAPIEDFSYALAAAVLVPLLWERGAKK